MNCKFNVVRIGRTVQDKAKIEQKSIPVVLVARHGAGEPNNCVLRRGVYNNLLNQLRFGYHKIGYLLKKGIVNIPGWVLVTNGRAKGVIEFGVKDAFDLVT